MTHQLKLNNCAGCMRKRSLISRCPPWNVCFEFLYRVLLKHHSKKNSARRYHNYLLTWIWSSPYSCNLRKVELARQKFEKSSNIKFPENPSSGDRVVPFGRTDVTKCIVILISNFRPVFNAVLCLLGNLPASELLVPTFRHLLSVPSS